MYAQSVHYLAWEGKTQAILTPRKSDRYPNGRKDLHLLKAVHSFGEILRQSIAQEWENNQDKCNVWVRDVLEPWASGARQHLEKYRKWKASRTTYEGHDGTYLVSNPNLNSEQEQNGPPSTPIEISVQTAPEIYQAVLYHLRRVSEAGQWPDTSTKRQVVMVTESKSNREGSSIDSTTKSKPNTSGSFSVGHMPRWQPKANTLFPELVKAAFALERALIPEREPSSTIAVNLNAQFRP